MNTKICVGMTIAVILAVTFAVIAAPHEGEPFDLRQPDGSFVPVIVWGDEFYQEVETPSGFTLIRDADGWICYAKLADDGGKYVSTGVRYTGPDSRPPTGEKRIRISGAARLAKHRRGQEALGFDNSQMIPRDRRNRRGGASAGVSPAPREIEEVVGLTIIVAFPEGNSYDMNGATGAREGATITALSQEDVYDFCNRKGGFNGESVGGSVRDWFLDVSNGQMDYYNIVTPIVYVDSAKSFYDRGERGAEIGTRPHVSEFVSSAIKQIKKLVDDGTLDLSSLTTEGPNNRGIYTPIALNILYSGSATQGWANGLWPHAGSNAGGRADTIDIGGGKRVVFNRYQMMSLGTEATPPSLATFVHENGHMVMRWPDLYPYPSANVIPPRYVGSYCIMATGNRNNPAPPNPYFSYMAGWIDVTDIADMGNAMLTHTSNSRSAYRYVRDDRESYFIEARQRAGRSANIPGEGLLIWHIDTSGRNTNHDQVDRPLVRLVRGDGMPYDTVNPGANAPFRAGGGSRNTAFDNTTTPAAVWYDGTASNLRISKISAPGGAMTFRIGDDESGPATYHLMVNGGAGSGWYESGETVNITAPETNSAGRYFFRWTSVNDDFKIEPDNIYARETRVLTEARDADVTSEYAPRHVLPGRVEADTAAFRAGFVWTTSTMAGLTLTGDRYASIRNADSVQYAQYVIDVAQDGAYQLTYRLRTTGTTLGTLYLFDETNGVALDTIIVPSHPTTHVRTVYGKTVSLNEGLSTWRLTAPPGTVAQIDWIGAEPAGLPRTHPLVVRGTGGIGTGDYLPNTRVDISADSMNAAGRYFFRWTSDDIAPDNALIRNTFVTTGANEATIMANFAIGHVLPGRVEADTAALRAGATIVADTVIGATGGRYTRFGIANVDTTQYALYVVDIAEDGLYQLTYRLQMRRNESGTLYLKDGASGGMLDSVNIISVPVSAMITVSGGAVNLRKGAAVWRIEAPPGTIARLDYLQAERIGGVAVLTPDRVIPSAVKSEDAAVVVPSVPAAFEITAGPNPARRDGNLPPAGINIFVTGKRVDKGELTIYDATGNVVKKINVNGEPPRPLRGHPATAGNNVNVNVNGGRRIIGSWDLRDAQNRPVADGTYLLRGVITTIDGKRERVSVVVGVR